MSSSIAQTQLQSFIELGENNASEHSYVKNAYLGNYHYRNYAFYGGLQFDLYSSNPNVLTGISLMAARDFSIKGQKIQLQTYYLIDRYSDLMYETNYGIKIEQDIYKHFLLQLGSNFKTYRINKAAQEQHNISREDSHLSENFNLIYNVTAYIKPQTHDWNASLSITNIDYFLINQSTNPIVNIKSYYKTSPKLTYFVELWYKQAGVLNIQANYFGYAIRGGIVWDL